MNDPHEDIWSLGPSAYTVRRHLEEALKELATVRALDESSHARMLALTEAIAAALLAVADERKR